ISYIDLLSARKNSIIHLPKGFTGNLIKEGFMGKGKKRIIEGINKKIKVLKFQSKRRESER
ncbi:MAG: hypothetical protein ACPLF9_08570, partial [Methanothermobacter tenebrarum]